MIPETKNNADRDVYLNNADYTIDYIRRILDGGKPLYEEYILIKGLIDKFILIKLLDRRVYILYKFLIIKQFYKFQLSKMEIYELLSYFYGNDERFLKEKSNFFIDIIKHCQR